MKKPILDRYARDSAGRVVIDITAEKVENLYNNFDRNTPYIKKELDQDLVDYITESVREIGREKFVIRFGFASTPGRELVARVTTSIHDYFLYLKELELRELGRMLRTSAILLLLGAAILTLSLYVHDRFGDTRSVASQVFAEGLTVAAWVSLWEALATFLIHWTPHRRQIKTCERIATAPIEFR